MTAEVTRCSIISSLEVDLRHYKDRNLPPMPYAIQAVIDHGRPYVGIGRPKCYRKRADKACFFNAADLAMQDRGTYVEGYASFGGGFPIYHAWITLDGVHAIDPTWRCPADRYVGVAFPAEIVARHGLDGRYWKPLMEDDTAIRALLAIKPALRGGNRAIVKGDSSSAP
jgi:hypothetical protein